MRAKHTHHPLPSYPVYSSAFLAPNELILGGGGGATKSGIKNSVRLYTIQDDRSIVIKDTLELEKGEDAPMSMAVHPETRTFVCGVNSILEELEKGRNENCRAFKVDGDKIQATSTKSTLSGKDIEDYQKVTVISPDGTLLAVAGSHDLAVLSYPEMTPISEPIHATKEIYDVAFSSDSLVVATTHNLNVYKLPPRTDEEKKGKQKSKANGTSEKASSLKLVETIGLPPISGGTCSFRAVRYHPENSEWLFAIVNFTAPRSGKSKTASRQAHICRYNATTWALEKTKKIGDRGVTCFDISPNGKYLAFGSSDLVVGVLDSKTLSPLVSILKAHEFPSTTLKFNPSSTLLVSGSADNSLRVISVPDGEASWTWTFVLLVLLAIFIAALAVAVQLNGR